MSFDRRDIRTSMDVFSLDNEYLGTVLSIEEGTVGEQPERVAESSRQTSAVNGEMFGPVPTQTLGNKGPIRQSARKGYATQPDTDQLIGDGKLTVGKWWGLIGRRTIPLDAVQTVSMERVVLRYRKDDLPRA